MSRPFVFRSDILLAFAGSCASDQFLGGFPTHWPIEQKSLTELAGQLFKVIGLVKGLCALGYHLHVHTVRHGNDGADDRHGALADPQCADKGTVYLEVVYGQMPQIAQRGVASSKVINLDSDSQRT